MSTKADAACATAMAQLRRECGRIMADTPSDTQWRSAVLHVCRATGWEFSNAATWLDNAPEETRSVAIDPLLPSDFIELPLRSGTGKTSMRASSIDEVCDHDGENCAVWTGGSARFIALPRLSVLALIAKAQQP